MPTTASNLAPIAGDAGARAARDVLAAGPLQRLAGVSAFGGALALVAVGWLGRDALPALLTPRTGGLLLLLVVALSLMLTTGFILLVVAPSLNRPAAELAEVAEAVANGDLTVRVADGRGAGQLNRVWRAVARMLGALRRLAAALRDASRDAASLAVQITDGADRVARRAQDTARTSVGLSQRSAAMAQTIDALAADALRLSDISAEVAMGAHEGVARNAQLRALAAASLERLDAGTVALDRLGDDVRESAGAVEALAQASEEIRSFVALVQKMARQSKLLALNASMEAARAGEHGDGFAVVAAEVRRLAADSTQAAKRCETSVAAIMERVELSRSLAARTVGTVAHVLDATRAGADAARAVEGAVAAAEEWTGSVETAAHHSSRLVQEMTGRLDALAAGTQTFAAAMRQVAATSEAQSAGTQEIAAAASTLAEAAEHLAGLVGTFRLAETDAAPPPGARRSDELRRYRPLGPTPAMVRAVG